MKIQTAGSAGQMAETAPKKQERKPFLFRLGWVKPYLYLLPVLIFISLWVYKPLLETFYLSFYQWNMLPTSPKQFVGIDNFINLVRLPDIGIAVRNTLIYTAGILPFTIFIPLLIAISTDNISKRMGNMYRALVFLPMIMAPVAISSIWRWILHPTNGIVNEWLAKLFSLSEPIRFFTDEKWAIWSITFITGWKLIGFSTLIFSAALTGLNKEYIEAAKMDRANRFQIIWHVLVPLLSPTILLMTLMSILFASELSFVYINVLTQGGPVNATTNIYYLLWTYGFQNFNTGISSAAAVVFFIGFGLIAAMFMKMMKKLSFYDN